ncbi:MAG: aldo/keto reductase [Spirosomataceae bacterium]
MNYFQLSNGDLMPALGLGTWKSAKGEVYGVVRKAIEVGYRHFDCAFLYGNEKEIGDALADAIKAREVKREELWITSKLWNNRHRAEQIRPAFQQSLDDLQVGYLDLYLIHWPIVVVDHKGFPETAQDLVSLTQVPLAETWKGLIQLQDSGLTKHIGVSNFSAKKIQAIWDATGVKPEVNQVELHPFLQQKTLKAYTDEHQIILTAYAPLGSLDRPANRKTAGEPLLFENLTIQSLAETRGISKAQLILAWAINSGICVIPKTVSEARLIENLAAADIVLTSEELTTMSQLDLHNRYIKGDFWCLEGSDYTLQNLWDE